MPARVAVGDPRNILQKFPAVATGAVTVLVDSDRTGQQTGPFTTTQVESSSTYSYALTAAQASEVDNLKLTFIGTVAGVERRYTQRVEVCSSYYFTVDEAREFGHVDVSKYSDSNIEKTRFSVENQIEANCGTSFVRRLVRERVSGSDDERFIRLTEPYVQELVSVTLDGDDITSQCSLDGRYVWSDAWTNGHRNISVVYESGWDEFPEEDLRFAAIEAVRNRLFLHSRAGTPQAVTSVTTDIGAMRIYTASLRQPFGMPEVDAVVLSWAKRVGEIL